MSGTACTICGKLRPVNDYGRCTRCQGLMQTGQEETLPLEWPEKVARKA